jgi:hypothetical protein
MEYQRIRALKHKRIQQKLPKSHANDAFVIANGNCRNRCYKFNVNQNRRNNVKGVFNYGKWIRLVSKVNEIKNIAISKVSLLRYQKGLAFGY